MPHSSVVPALTTAAQERSHAPELTELLDPELPSLTDEIVREIQQCVPDLDQRLRDRLEARIRLGVEQVLGQFLHHLADPVTAREQSADFHRALGRAAYRAGRTMDVLPTAYHTGARVAWRRLIAIGRDAGLTPERMYGLAETIFFYVDLITADSVQGYKEIRESDPLKQCRRQLLKLILADTPATTRDHLSRHADQARWRLPRTVACVALDPAWRNKRLLPPAVGSDILMDLDESGPVLLLPDPDGPMSGRMLERALRGCLFAIGPTVPLSRAALSLRLARQTLILGQRGALRCDRYLRSTDHLPALLLMANQDITALMNQIYYTPMAALTPNQQARLSETLLLWLATGAPAPELAEHLSVHPQTVRYRTRHLEELFGSDLRDPEWRTAMLLLLRARQLQGTVPRREPACT